MAGVTLDAQDTARLQEIVAALADPGPDPIPDPLPWQVLEPLAELLHTDDITIGGYATPPRHLQSVNGGDLGGQWGSRTPEDVVADSFRQEYRASEWSYCDRSGDFASVTIGSDSGSPRELSPTRAGETPSERSTGAGIRLAPNRQLRLLGWRRGADFTERERFLVLLLRPHVQLYYDRWRRQHPTGALLTKRQLVVLDLVREGYTNEQIGHRLHLSEGTVRTHLSNIYERLGVQSRTAAVAAVYRGAG